MPVPSYRSRSAATAGPGATPGCKFDESQAHLAKGRPPKHQGEGRIAHEHDAIRTVPGADGELPDDADLGDPQVGGQADIALLEIGSGFGIDQHLAGNFDEVQLVGKFGQQEGLVRGIEAHHHDAAATSIHDARLAVFDIHDAP